MKRLLIVLLSILMLFTLTSCEEIEAVLGLIPKFSTEIPNLVAGKFYSFTTEENEALGIFNDGYIFNSQELTFEYIAEEVSKKGTYEVKYSTFAITECAGKLYLRFESGEAEIFDFKLECTANGGPEALYLNKELGQYIYMGDV